MTTEEQVTELRAIRNELEELKIRLPMDITFRNRTEYGIINSWKNATS